MPDPSRAEGEEQWSDVWLWTCDNEGCATKGGEVYWDITDEEPSCPQCGGPMEQHLQFVPASALLTVQERAQEAERNLELGTKEMGFMVNTIERLRLNASVMAVEARDECLRLSSGQLEAAEQQVAALEQELKELRGG